MTAVDRLLRGALNANALRRRVGGLRTRHPALYARLNGVRKWLLGGRGGVQAYQANALVAFGETARVRGARILEVGSDPELTVLRRLVAAGAREAIGVNNAPSIWKEHPGGRIERGRCRLIEADAAALPFEAGAFDAIFSVAVFEHILDLPRALEEMHRVLAPGGVVYANFGPIWSGGKGHHLRVEVDGSELRHFLPEKNPLPDFTHLLLDEDALRAALASRVEAKLVEPAIEWVFRNRGINRLFHHDYLRIFEASPFTVLRTRAERDPLDPTLERILAMRHPGGSDFGVTNMEVVLVRDDA